MDSNGKIFGFFYKKFTGIWQAKVFYYLKLFFTMQYCTVGISEVKCVHRGY